MRRFLTNIALAALLAAPGTSFAQGVGESDLGSFGSEQEAGRGSGRETGIQIQPYIEAAQVLSQELTPGDDLVTYTRLAAGVDAGFAGRNSAGSVSLRYERQISYDDDFGDFDTISGVARASLALVPRTLTLETGALASRTRVERNGFATNGAFGNNSASTSQLYSIFAGPSLQTRQGPLEVSGAYRVGYSRVESPDAFAIAPGGARVDFFDDSVTHNASARVGAAPGTLLPVIGVGIGGGWNRQDISNLDQRIDNKYVRADVTLPVSLTLALVGGAGYEDNRVSSRDALRDGDGNLVIDGNGRFVTDDSQPRQIAYETDGFIWDVGIMWRPSRRTSLSANVGRRYGSTTYYGTLSYEPDQRSSLNVNVYDNITGFGGLLTDGLDGLGTDFEAFRNPISGDLGGCVVSSEAGNCALARLGSLRSSAFRSRGVTASYGRTYGPTTIGVGAGYDRRRFIAATGTVLGDVNGALDENTWVSAYLNHSLDRQSSVGVGVSASWFESGLDNAGDGVGYSANAAYSRNLVRGLDATFAIGLDGVSRDDRNDFAVASALIGLRYTFR